MTRHEHVAAAVGIDDPDLLATRVCEPTAVGRPLRVGDILVRCGDLDRSAAAAGSERQHDELPGARDLLRADGKTVSGMEAELARRIDCDEPLDRQPSGLGSDSRTRRTTARSDGLLHRSPSGLAAAGGQPSRAAHGPMIA